jgi:hypothetical protein
MPTGLSSFKDRGYFAADQHPDHLTVFSGLRIDALSAVKRKDSLRLCSLNFLFLC